MSITQFIASTNCGTTAPVFTYKAFKSGGTTEYVAADYIEINPSTGEINVNAGLNSGTYTIIVKGTL